jgi:2-polyprenyl-3-methyl-5-hydroxy-6-metoxy-1,4-benzoquinol methylase
LTPILSLGDHYVSDFLKPGQVEGAKAPLELVLCRRCHLLQLKHTVSPEHMYRNYWYKSGTNQTMRQALADIAHTAEQLVGLQVGDAVLDIGCNDGTLLGSYQTGGLRRIGFDPAQNLATLARQVCDDFVNDFFTAAAFRPESALHGARPRVVTSIAMFYDLEDPLQFVHDVIEVMDPDGLWIVQQAYLPLMLKTNEVGNICHEHLAYYSLHSFEYLMAQCGLEVVDVSLNDINGGSFRTYVRRQGADPAGFGDATYRALAAARVAALRADEVRLGLDDLAPYTDFAFWVERIKTDVVTFIRDEVSRGKRVYVYGASTKGNTLLQYFGLDRAVITAAAERNPDKWGLETVGTRIPIVSEADARAAKPDYFLVLPWHFIEEFQQREKAYLLSGGRFIMPMPRFALI